MEAVCLTAKMWGTRPSALLAIADPVTALAFDLAATAWTHAQTEAGAETPAETGLFW